ncbi:MAG TPA: hypothetical protein PLQ13_00175 [Candidatus Krumholzibacteria bacterium]|nr:hypothetical protein [Candidatus Krumholzibacteria bacterium]
MRSFVLVFVICGLALAGCGDDDPSPVDPQPTDPRPTSPTALVQQFALALEHSDFTLYAPLIDPSFVLGLQQATVGDYGLPSPWLTATEDLLATEAAFSGDPAPRSGEVPAAGLAQAQVNLLQQEAAWSFALPPSPYAGTTWAPFRIDADFLDVIGAHTSMRGVLEFYVRPDTTDPGDVRWQLAAMVDLTETSKDGVVANALAWGDLKALFRAATAAH